MAHDVFISYSQSDKTIADAVCHGLEQGVRCWIAPRDVGAGSRWGTAIVDAITASHVLVVIFSAAANASRHVLNEVATALDSGSTVIPFRVENIMPTGELRLHLGGVHWLDALSPPLEAHIDQLIDSVKRSLPTVADGQNPPPLSAPQAAIALDLEKAKALPTRRRRIGLLLGVAAVLVVVAVGFVGRDMFRRLASDGAAHLPSAVPSPSTPTQPAPTLASQPVRTLTGHTGAVRAVAFSPDGRTVASASDDMTVILWDPANGHQLRTLSGHFGPVWCVAFSPDGRTIASGSQDKTVKLWDVWTGNELRMISDPLAPVHAVAFAPDGKTLAWGEQGRTVGFHQEGSIGLFDIASGHERQTLEHRGWVSSLVYTPDGHLLGSAEQDLLLVSNLGVHLIDATSGEEIRVLKGQGSSAGAIAVSPNGKTLALGTTTLLGKDDFPARGGTVELWDLSSGSSIGPLPGDPNPVRSVAFSSDGEFLAAGTGSSTIELWDLSSKRSAETLRGHSDAVNFVAFSPDGNTLVSASSDKTLKLWSVMVFRWGRYVRP